MNFVPRHGGQLRAIAERFHVNPASLLDFSANINPDGPPVAVVSALKTALDDPSNLTQYPDLDEPLLKASISRYAGVPLQNIVVSSGFVQLLDATLRALQIQSCVLPVPAFNEYRIILERNCVSIHPNVLCDETNFNYDAAALLSKRSDALLLANPQNPSGVLHSKAAMLNLVREAAASDTLVLLDEAFIDYVPADSLAPLTEQHANLIVFRSVTKFFGIPGLRVAYAVANQEIARKIEAQLPPWSISTLASAGAISALSDEPYALLTRQRNDERRTAWAEKLIALGFRIYPSAGNFLLLRLPLNVDAYSCWQTLICSDNILTRSCENYEGLATGHLRIAVKDAASNERLLSALANVIGRQIAVLQKIDGFD